MIFAVRTQVLSFLRTRADIRSTRGEARGGARRAAALGGRTPPAVAMATAYPLSAIVTFRMIQYSNRPPREVREEVKFVC